ncbi:MAG: hypothetical protein M1820_007085 [Bogoriella megaspora]|nr:MAG: hypothetical protein M1820_007085 [Bogoriella megaspora]
MSNPESKQPENKQTSYLSAGLSAFSPWSSRSASPKPDQDAQVAPEPALASTKGGDHTAPKRKPNPSGQQSTEDKGKPLPIPKKYTAFSRQDSKALEAAFQKLADEEDSKERSQLQFEVAQDDGDLGSTPQQRSDQKPNTNLDRSDSFQDGSEIKVPVNEDFLFDVDVERRELAPAYWLGPVYDVRRGTWFYQDGSSSKPADENLATQLEEGYLKVKPWRFPPAGSHKRNTSQGKSEFGSPSRTNTGGTNTPKSISSPTTTGPSGEAQSLGEALGDNTALQPLIKTHRLFGAHMNSLVTYQDSTTAWLLTDDFLSRMSSTMYERFAGGGHFAGVKLIRGFTESVKKATADKEKDSPTRAVDDTDQARKEAEEKLIRPQQMRTRSKSDSLHDPRGSSIDLGRDAAVSPVATDQRRLGLERQISSLVSAQDDREAHEEEVRKRDEREIQEDYQDQDATEQGREIEHLILVTHGIGQRLGLRTESINFVHDVNTLRKTLKAVYASSPDLQALNSEIDRLPKNCRIQVLPICWRHKLDFPKQSLRHNRREHDLGDTEFEEDEEYPNLEDITVEGIPTVRNLLTDLALDILLYQSPAYKDHIARIVRQECNRIYKLFKERNPAFKGKVSLIGHSLGSAIMFDILCHLRDSKSHVRRQSSLRRRRDDPASQLDFDVEDFYSLGSPIALFQMLKGRTLVARQSPGGVPSETPSGDLAADPFDPTSLAASKMAAPPSFNEITTSSPKCQQMYNIFHPTDPIAYRIEPLISPAMASLKPQPLPSIKRTFGAAVGQGISGIGTSVGKSVSGLWSSFSSGIASSLLNRSLGLSAEDPATAKTSAANQQSRVPLSMGAGTNTSLNPHFSPVTQAQAVAGEPSSDASTADAEQWRLAQAALSKGESGEHPPTRLDQTLETLYSGFEKRRKSQASDADIRDLGEHPEWRDAEERGRKLRKEEAKVRALNLNGRVDYSIQE